MTNKIERIGFTSVMDGEELWVNTTSDEKVAIVIKNKDIRWDFYCKYVRITVEKLTEDEFKDWNKMKK